MHELVIIEAGRGRFLDRRAEKTGGRTKLHNKEHHDLYPASNVIAPVVVKS